ncbi:hypothetical protein QUF54_01920 [Candidatus Marithioploca araucensis]|uniref:Uncharacterized protein n=1 Tax=Candidatus Marithioploca araucensis TaxID=70273 RepID=A0ABT7VQZ4_9GAMM|nr:hypothetical protein [Candidatus Marithioploca araucensis]
MKIFSGSHAPALVSGSHAPAWEPIHDAPASSGKLAGEVANGNTSASVGGSCSHAPALFLFPRAGVGTDSRRASVERKQDAGASRMGSHASAWEPEKKY